MYALAVQSLPEGKDWLYEVKFDGYRCLARRDNGGANLWSRRGNLFTGQFPEIAAACEQLAMDGVTLSAQGSYYGDIRGDLTRFGLLPLGVNSLRRTGGS
jgi:bifunctional non-homologous end joining protein LigD